MSVCMHLCLFVTDKLGSLTIYPRYDTYSESSWFRESFDTQFVCINCMLRSFSLTKITKQNTQPKLVLFSWRLAML